MHVKNVLQCLLYVKTEKCEFHSSSAAFLGYGGRWMTDPIKIHIATSPTCTRSKASSQHPSGLLHPLSTPHQPCSHIALYFITCLPVYSWEDSDPHCN